MSIKGIRNFAIIAHIDAGKSTLADRLMEATGLLPRIVGPPPASLAGGEARFGRLAFGGLSDRPSTPRIDRMELETERGVTIKLKAVRMEYKGDRGVAGSEGWQGYSPEPLVTPASPVNPCVLNMIDTPGHADFSYEVSRSLAACEGALLLVDATQGVQAQTLSHLEKARELGLTVVGVINKIDSPLARVEEAEEEMRQLGIEGSILRISALKGVGTGEVLRALVERIPAPRGKLAEPLRALVFDSTFDAHLGTVAYVRVVDGELKIKDQKSDIKTKIKFLGTGVEAEVKELGFFNPDRKSTERLFAGEVGYIATGLRDPRTVRVGDTIVQSSSRQVTALPGYQPPQSFVFASFFSRNLEFGEFRKALQTLRLEEPAIAVEEISSTAFGRGFRIGFLGTFHLEIVKERLEREFGLELVVTKPTVAFGRIDGRAPGQPEESSRRVVELPFNAEPWILLTVLLPSSHLSGVMKLLAERRGKLGEVETLGNRLKVSAELPLLEFVRGFYNALKSSSRGYASLSWEFSGYRPARLAELEILVHGAPVEGLAEVVLREEADRLGREKLKKLKEFLPQQQFAYSIQARASGKILAREDVPAIRKDVLAKLSGGHVERKMKKLQEQKKGKARLAKFGKVDLPPEAFLV
uniref:Elongation factor 4 n=1 Tax=candidate division WWE3 bacterium TaxID=2053526 RepID=A0A831Z1F3_UNCKA